MPQTINDDRTFQHHLRYRFGLLSLTGTLLFALMLLAAGWLDEQSHLETIQARERGHLAIASTQIREDLQAVSSDLRIVSSLPALLAYVDHPQPEQHDTLARLLLVWARETRRYDHLAYIDERGQKTIQIADHDGKPAIVPTTEGSTPETLAFLNEAVKHPPGEIHADLATLRPQNGQPDKTHKPVIRFAIPVVDSQQQNRGILQFDYLAGQLLNNFRASMNSEEHRAMLLDETGQVLGSLESTRPFGPNFPEEWSEISGQDEGMLSTRHGLFFYTTLPALDPRTHTSPVAVAGTLPPRWKIVSHIPPEQLNQEALHQRPMVWLVLSVLYFFLLIATWFVIRAQLIRQHDRAALAFNEARQQRLISNLPVGVYLFRFHEDGTGNFEYVSEVFGEILGTETEQILQDPDQLFSRVHPDDYPKFMEKHRQASLTRQPFRWEGRFMVRNDTRWIRISSDAVPDTKKGSLWSGVVSDITERKVLEKELERQAHIDVLTTLNNRRHFFELAEHELSRARRHNLPLSALMLDIDHFKRCNDTWGHAVGDRVLQKLAEVCRHTLREIDIPGRLGGEEFAVLLVETDACQAMEAAERLRQALADATLALDDGQILRFTVSIGVAYLTADDQKMADLLRRADMALYAAKNSGRNRVSDTGSSNQRDAL